MKSICSVTDKKKKLHAGALSIFDLQPQKTLDYPTKGHDFLDFV